MLQILKLSIRVLTKSPGFSVVVILLIALGIGANTAIFSVVRAVLLRPLPLDHPEQLVRLRENFAQTSGDETQLNLAPGTWQRWRESNDVFSDIAAATGASLTLTGQGEAQYVAAARVSFNFLSVLGIRPSIGRNFLSAEDQPGGDPVVIIGDAFWHTHFAGAPDVLGRQLMLDGVPHTIVGVLPHTFRHPYRAEIWLPLALRIDPAVVAGHYLYVPARLKPGVTIDQARRAMREVCHKLAQEFPGPNNPAEAWIMPLHDSFAQDSQPKLLAVSAAAAFVLLIAAANIASLLLARHIERQNEASIRAALGASRWRLVRESLVQSLLLTGVGCSLGLLLAAWLTGPIYALSPMASDATGNALREFDATVRLDAPVLAVSIGLTLLIGLGFALLPALRGARPDLQLALKGNGRTTTVDRGTRRTLGLLVTGEIVIAVVLLVATGLMLKSFRNLVGERWGFETENRLTFDVTFSQRLRPDPDSRSAYVTDALARLRSLPGVLSATVATPDLVTLGVNLAAITPDGSAPPEPRGYFLTSHRLIVPGYFADSGIHIMRGRAVDQTDQAGGQKVAVISESFARRFWPGADPIGKIIKRGRATDPRPPYVVVGVAADIKGISDSLDGDVVGIWYLPYVQNANYLGDDLTFIVHTAEAPENMQAAVRAELARVDPAIAAYHFNTLARMVDDTYVEDRFALLLVGLFGVLGLLLSAVGLYGLLSFQVARRTREIGVRTALGASTGDIIALVFRQAARLVLTGLAAGSIVSLAFSHFLRSQLHGVSTSEPTAYLFTAAVLVVVAAVACWLPALRAARVDPLVALRSE